MLSSENPADLPTRGLTVPEIEHSKLWWSSPDWLVSSHDSWPKWQPPQPVLQDVETETARVSYECSNVASHGPQDVNLSVWGINEKKYSSLRKLLRVTCSCLKFVKKRLWDLLSESRRMLIGKRYALLAEVFSSLSDGQFICATDIKLAMLLWIYCAQQNRFCNVLSAIKEDKSHCLKWQLGLKIDDMGILRCYGRFLNATIAESTKYPKLLLRREHLTTLLITEVHQRLIHAGVAHTLAQIREEYWIPQGRAEVRSVLSQCLLC